MRFLVKIRFSEPDFQNFDAQMPKIILNLFSSKCERFKSDEELKDEELIELYEEAVKKLQKIWRKECSGNLTKFKLIIF